jgi:hypothetical protein
MHDVLQTEGRGLTRPGRRRAAEIIMTNPTPLSLPELEDRIAILRDNIRQLTEQAAAASGEQNEARAADRISQQSEELQRLVKARDDLQKREAQARK